jgi:proprotein convertase subtilisin/kexin type 5
LAANNQCICNTGFYSVVNVTNSLSECKPCNPICDSCTGGPQACDLCNPNFNKVPGFDSAGRLTCICASGYFLNPNGSCLQTNCRSDPFCEECSNSAVSICLKCKPSLNRVLNTNSYICECASGFYQNSTLNQCVACPNACATCTSSLSCPTCVVGAFKSANTCACLSGLFFTTTPIRYCQACTEKC